jgi:hypothetical protein
VGCPGRLAAGCPPAIAALTAMATFLSPLLPAFWALLVFLPDLSAFLLPFFALPAYLAGSGRVLFFRGGPVFLAGLLIGVGGIFLQAGV